MARDTSRRSRRSRRGGGTGIPGISSIPRIQGTLGTLLRTTLHQAGELRDAALRQARSSRDMLDAARLERQRRDALADLGEAVLELYAQGGLNELEQDDEAADLIDEIERIERRLRRARDAAPGAGSRRRGEGEGARAVERFESDESDEDEDEYADDGIDAAGDREAVSSSGWRPPAPTGEVRVWRPVMPPDPEADHDPDDDPDDERARGAAREPKRVADRASRSEAADRAGRSESAGRSGRSGRARRRGAGAGGIAFVADQVGADDDDLAAYMHEDDVPDGTGSSGE